MHVAGHVCCHANLVVQFASTAKLQCFGGWARSMWATCIVAGFFSPYVSPLCKLSKHAGHLITNGPLIKLYTLELCKISAHHVVQLFYSFWSFKNLKPSCLFHANKLFGAIFRLKYSPLSLHIVYLKMLIVEQGFVPLAYVWLIILSSC